jgi:hypothetical protein
MERFTAGWFENLLLQQWIPAMPEVQAKLERGLNSLSRFLNRRM